MTNIVYKPSSIYAKTRFSGRFLSYYEHRAIPPRNDDKYAFVDHRWENRPDLVALDLYGSSDYNMVIPLRNYMEDPIFDMVYGRILIVPDLTHVKKVFG